MTIQIETKYIPQYQRYGIYKNDQGLCIDYLMDPAQKINRWRVEMIATDPVAERYFKKQCYDICSKDSLPESFTEYFIVSTNTDMDEAINKVFQTEEYNSCIQHGFDFIDNIIFTEIKERELKTAFNQRKEIKSYRLHTNGLLTCIIKTMSAACRNKSRY